MLNQLLYDRRLGHEEYHIPVSFLISNEVDFTGAYSSVLKYFPNWLISRIMSIITKTFRVFLIKLTSLKSKLIL